MMKKFIYQKDILRGFTLIEILLTLSLVSILGAFGAAQYREFTTSRRVSTAADEVVSILNLAKSRAISQVKPAEIAACANAELLGYRVVTCPSGCGVDNRTYELQVACGANGVSYIRIGNAYKLPSGVSFASSQNVLFRVLDGSAQSSGNIVVQSGSKMKTITVSQQSLIASSGLEPVVPSSPPPSIITFTASPISIAYNGTATLTWATSNVSACYASGGWSGNKPANNATGELVGPLTSTTLYTLTCFGPGGQDQKSITVTVGPPPPPSITFSGISPVNYNTNTTLSWSTSLADSCSGSNNGGLSWGGAMPTSSSGESAGPLIDSVIFTLSCIGPGGSNSKQAVVNVNDPSGTIARPYNPPTNAPSISTTSNWKNTYFYTTTSGLILKQVGFYVSGGTGGYSFKIYEASFNNWGTLILSGTLSTTPDSQGFYTKNVYLPLGTYSNGKNYILSVNQTNGTSRYGSNLLSSGAITFRYRNEGSSSPPTTTGTFAIKLIY